VTELNSKLSRTTKIYGVEGDVIVSISPEGVSFRMKGMQKGVTARWDKIIAACDTPDTVPAFLAAKPLEFLRWSGTKLRQRKQRSI
jgi:hypothetical protein